MKKTLLTTMFIAAFGGIINAQTSEVFSDNFNSYDVDANIKQVEVDGLSKKYAIVNGSGVVTASGYDGNGVDLTATVDVTRDLVYSLDITEKISSLVRGTKYSFSPMIKGDGTHAFQAQIVAKWNYEGSTTTKTYTSGKLNSNQWESRTVEFTYPEDEDSTLTYLQIKIVCDAKDGVEFHLFTDDWILKDANATRISKHVSYNLSVGPNPSQGQFRLSTEKPIAGYAVFNTAGQVVKQVNGVNSMYTNIDITGENKGLYYIKVTYENGKSEVVKALVR